jgi:hypothetical protein|tara:strand:- start:2096 stop:2353 length:258 start_codon:yes stop_codon:yes gene_type:complete
MSTVKSPRTSTMSAVCDEYRRGLEIFRPFISAHEAYGVLKEEVDEFWDEVKRNTASIDYASMIKELIQIAAVAIRTIDQIKEKSI